MAGLEEVGIAGPDYLREALTNCSDPLTAIEDFQVENGILLPSLRPMLPLLDLHGVQRLDFHQTVLEQLRDRLLQQINELGQLKDTINPTRTRHSPHFLAPGSISVTSRGVAARCMVSARSGRAVLWGHLWVV